MEINENSRQENNKRIIQNTLYLYARMLLSLFISLFTARIVFNTLGVSNYGVLNVAGGVISMFTFLNASMAGATSRFLTFELGHGSQERLKHVFNSAMSVHLIISLGVILLAETIGLWFLNYKLVIPKESMFAANWVYQLSIINSVFAITQAPYSASIIAHEKMKAFAFFDMASTLINLVIILLLVILPGNKLIIYATMTASVGFGIMLTKRLYAIRHFKYCRISFSHMRKDMIKPMLAFSGLDLVGNMSTMARSQGVSMLVNMFFGTIANAAIGIANSIQGAINGFASNVTIAMRPQIIKSYSSGDHSYMEELLIRGSKFSFYIILILSLPVLLEMPFILKVWLGTVPEYTVWISRLTLMFIYFSNISYVLVCGVHATGDIRGPSLINGSLYLSVIPITYVVYKLGGSIYIPFALNALFVLFGAIGNFCYTKKYVKTLSLRHFIVHVVLSLIMIAIISSILPLLALYLFPDGWLGFFVVCLTSLISTVSCIYTLGLSKSERVFALQAVNKFIKKK